MTNIVLLVLKIYVSTNLVPGWVGGPDLSQYIRTNKDGYFETLSVPAIAINHPPKTVVVTNYVIGFKQGTNTIELMTLHQ